MKSIVYRINYRNIKNIYIMIKYNTILIKYIMYIIFRIIRNCIYTSSESKTPYYNHHYNYRYSVF